MSHQAVLLRTTVLSRLVPLLLLLASTQLPLFDASPRLVPISKWARPLLRWDAFHFMHIAQHGYTFEHEWAFLPGAPFLMQSATKILPSDGPTGLLLGGALLAMACDTTSTMYQLSLHHLRSPSLAFLASLVSLLPSSPTTLYFAPNTEPFFTYMSYKGMLYCAQEHWLAAAFAFSLASTIRSNGILLSGFVLWGLLIQPFFDGKKPSFMRILYSTILIALIVIPFVYYNYSAYTIFCGSTVGFIGPPRPAWCQTFPPSIYAHVQSTYWNVGFMRYWTRAQLPNFLIAAPPLLLLFALSMHHVWHGLIPRLVAYVSKTKIVASPSQISTNIDDLAPNLNAMPSRFLAASLTPHAIHALLLSTMLLFTSHTQIILRLAASMPFTSWAASWLLIEHPRCGRWWVAWSVAWGAVSVVLWGTFLPPA